MTDILDKAVLIGLGLGKRYLKEPANPVTGHALQKLPKIVQSDIFKLDANGGGML